MESRKITATLVAILALACAIITVVLISVNRKIHHIPQTAVNDMVDVLDRAGIGISPDMIGTKRENGDVYIFNSADYFGSVARLMQNDAVTETFATPDGEILLYENGALIEFGKGFYFRYSLDGDKHLVPDTEYFTERLSPAMKEYKEVADAAVRFLDKGSRDFSLGGMITIVTTVDAVYGDGDNYYAVCSRTMDGVAITDNTVTCTYHDGVVSAAEGTWCFLTKGESYSAQLTDQLNILFSAMKDIAIPEGKRVKITSIGRCYSLYYYGENDDFCLIPCWQVSTDKAGDYIYNALDGALSTKK